RSLTISTGFSKFLDLDRCYSVSRIPVKDGKELVLYNIHSSAYGGSDEIRTAQITQLTEDMLAEYKKGNYCVCGGDFNHDFTGDSAIVLGGSGTGEFGWAQPFPAELLPEGISRCIDYDDESLVATCRNCDVPYGPDCKVFVVDGFLVSDNVSVLELHNVDTGFAYSDHQPVVMRFQLGE
ncbi:MAG: endonuclease/exonuclease/phosphatase family protein, partial [Lachnospiraceae bacterium]|nr:endonuclease/exonuclease/phosphatase family protein [Lachnospiraceae bacterium]